MEYSPSLIESAQPWPDTDKGMECCPGGCEGHFMQPMKWEQVTEDGERFRGHWRIWAFCGECRDVYEGVFNERQIDAFDEALDEGTVQLTQTERTLERENMQYELGVLTTAFEADLITADDFRLPRTA